MLIYQVLVIRYILYGISYTVLLQRNIFHCIKKIKMIQQSVLTIQIEMTFPVEISQKTSDGPLQLLLIKLKVVLMKGKKEKIFGTFGPIKNIQMIRQDVISTTGIHGPEPTGPGPSGSVRPDQDKKSEI